MLLQKSSIIDLWWGLDVPLNSVKSYEKVSVEAILVNVNFQSVKHCRYQNKDKESNKESKYGYNSLFWTSFHQLFANILTWYSPIGLCLVNTTYQDRISWSWFHVTLTKVPFKRSRLSHIRLCLINTATFDGLGF